MSDFAEEIKGLIKHDNNTEDESNTMETKTIDRESSDPNEINGNYKEDSNTCDSQDSQNSGDNNTENTEEDGPSSQEQNGLTEASSDAEADDGNKSQSNGVRVLNIVPLSESEESNIDIGDGRAGVVCSWPQWSSLGA